MVLLRFIAREARCICRSHCRTMSSKGSAAARQSRVMEKLFGNRVAGSKKRHWPMEGMVTTDAQSSLFKGAAKTHNGKNTTRRMQVLDKLFMENISQLLAEVESVLNRGLQIQRVKISSDFALVNVYWVGSGDALADDQLAAELKRHSGRLRHELSQLRLMGEVPRISFVHDRTLANLTQVDAMLRNMNLDDEEDGGAVPNVVAAAKKDAFFGQRKVPVDAASDGTCNSDLPEMRHDVLGLDHRDIMTRILAKMKKSKAAWDVHNNQLAMTADVPATENGGMKHLDRVNLQLAQAAEIDPKFDEFLAKRRERKNTPERKKHNHLVADYPKELNESFNDEAALSANHRRLLHEDDYIDDEYEDRKK